jgi:hypothetical protein
MPAPLLAPRVSSGFPPLATAGSQTARLGGLIALGTEAGGQTVSPDGQTAPCNGVRGSGALPVSH